MKGPGIFDYAVAITIWHEMAHIDRADEATAQRAEEQLWTEFVVAGRADRFQGMRYLALLKNRRRHCAPSLSAPLWRPLTTLDPLSARPDERRTEYRAAITSSTGW